MSKAALSYISDTLTGLGIPYAFMEYESDTVPDIYFVGEYNEPESPTREEDGYQEMSFILTGTSRSWLDLENAKALIEANITRTAILPNGNGIAVFYGGAMPVPTGDAELRRIQINLIIKEWSVN